MISQISAFSCIPFPLEDQEEFKGEFMTSFERFYKDRPDNFILQHRGDVEAVLSQLPFPDNLFNDRVQVAFGLFDSIVLRSGADWTYVQLMSNLTETELSGFAVKVFEMAELCLTKALIEMNRPGVPLPEGLESDLTLTVSTLTDYADQSRGRFEEAHR